MKKFIAIMLAAAMALSLTACQKSDELPGARRRTAAPLPLSPPRRRLRITAAMALDCCPILSR